jgi:hypothetical protein
MQQVHTLASSTLKQPDLTCLTMAETCLPHLPLGHIPSASAVCTPVDAQETQQWFVLQRLTAAGSDPAAEAAAIKEAPDITPPVFHPPWQPLK